MGHGWPQHTFTNSDEHVNHELVVPLRLQAGAQRSPLLKGTGTVVAKGLLWSAAGRSLLMNWLLLSLLLIASLTVMHMYMHPDYAVQAMRCM